MACPHQRRQRDKDGRVRGIGFPRLQSPEDSWNIAALAPQFPNPACWSAMDNTVIFSMAIGGTTNLWETAVSPETEQDHGRPAESYLGHRVRNASVLPFRQHSDIREARTQNRYLVAADGFGPGKALRALWSGSPRALRLETV